MIKHITTMIITLLLLTALTASVCVGAQEIDSGKSTNDESPYTETSVVELEEQALDEVPNQTDVVHGTGFCREDGRIYYYRNGVRVEQNWYQAGRYQTAYNRSQWLYELMQYAGEKPKCSPDNGKAVFELAKKRGIISSYSSSDYTASVDRLFAAQTLVKALNYPRRSVGTVRDSGDASLQTAAYYGYFIPDDNDRLYPNALVTVEEFDAILSELKLYQKLRYKRLTVFGDSIMYGFGNEVGNSSYEGIAEIIGVKYGMAYQKYAKTGAVIGITDGKSHIADQVRSAVKDGRKSDLIIINGGANDAWHTDIKSGNIADGYDMSSIGESSYSNGFEKAMWLIRNHWKDTPVIFIRSHNMKLGSSSRRIELGERAMQLCEKWNAAGIDLYNDSELDGTVAAMAKRYTCDPDTLYRGIHPNALGYAKYYLPPIGEAIASLFEMRINGDCSGDGEVNVIDVYYIQLYDAALPVDVDGETMMRGDIDGSGEVDIVDATYIQRGLAALDISPYRIGEVI